MDFGAIEALSGAFAESRILHVAVQLGLFAAVADGATAEEAALSRGLNPRATLLMLNALTGMGLLMKKAGVFYPRDAVRRYLLPESPDDFGGMVALEAASWGLWERLDDAVRSGQPVRPADMYQSDPAETRRFIMAMDSLVRARGDAIHIARHMDLTGVRRLLDVGSGPGTYPVAICRAHPDISATIFDLPGTLEVTREVLAREHMTHIGLAAGDYNTDPLPAGFDMVILSNILHSEDEAHCAALLKKCHAALNPGGRIVIKDHVLDDDLTHPAGGAVFSLYLLLRTPGRDYGFSEIRDWLDAAGFGPATQTVLPPPFTSSLVIARKS